MRIPVYGDGTLYPPCESCLAEWPADLVLDEPGKDPHFVCLDCACTAFQSAGRYELLASLERERRTTVFLRHDPKSPSYRGGR